jgi:nitrogen fixation protein NifB
MNSEIKAVKNKSEEHPCFSPGAKHEVARVHLPVAPKCNVQCGFCNRSFDCVNESRPGVTSKILQPKEALDYLEYVLKKVPKLGVAGIAGPGDPLANADKTLDTLGLIAQAHPDIKLCLSTNGLGLPPVVDDLVALGVNHVTVTVNAVDPEIGAKVYPWMRINGRNKRGVEAAEYLLAAQEEGIRALHARGVTVKVNMIAIPTINATHLPEVARVVKSWGADLINVIPLIPVEDTLFGDLPPLKTKDFVEVKNQVSEYLPLMLHCARCRADAVGLIGKDEGLLATYGDDNLDDDAVALEKAAAEDEKKTCCSSAETFGLEGAGKAAAIATKPVPSVFGQAATVPVRVAVATREGFLINAHLGEAQELFIFEKKAEGWEQMEKRPAPKPGAGFNRWTRLGQLIADCSAIFVGGVGMNPREALEKEGIGVYEVEGTITSVLEEWEEKGGIEAHQKRTAFECGSECQGTGGGCG